MLSYDNNIFNLLSSELELSDADDGTVIVAKLGAMSQKNLSSSFVSTANGLDYMNLTSNQSATQSKKVENEPVEFSSDDKSCTNKESVLSSDDTNVTNKLNSYEDEAMVPADHKNALYCKKAWDLWSKFDGVTVAKFLHELQRQ
jgi:hypothetical protein